MKNSNCAKTSQYEDQLNCYRDDFRNYGCVNITELLNGSVSFLRLSEESHQLLQYKTRRKLIMEETSSTPRYMYNIKQEIIKKYSQYIPQVYSSDFIKNIISSISGEEVFDLPCENEQYLINFMSEAGDTHGWHWDDYSYAIVFIIKAPKLESGGLVQCVPNTRWQQNKNAVNKTLCANPIYTYFFQDCNAYLLKSDTTMHRVTPLTRPDTRLIINMSWANTADLIKPINHSTMNKLYS